jgi:hypothetical protein
MRVRVRSRIAAGAVAGLTGGIIAASLLSVMAVTAPQGNIMRVITLVAHTVRSDSFLVGWLVQLGVGVALGALFGVLYAVIAGAAHDPGSTVGWAELYAIGWWVLGWLLVMPLATSLRPFLATVTTRALDQFVIAGLLASLGYGAVLGGTFAWLSERRR